MSITALMTPRGKEAAQRKCGARTRGNRKGGRCQLPAGWGTAHVGFGRCRLHGGNTPSQIKSIAPQLLRAEMPVHIVLRDLDRKLLHHTVWEVLQQLDLTIQQVTQALSVVPEVISSLDVTVQTARTAIKHKE